MNNGSSHGHGRPLFALWSPEMASAGGVQSYMWRLWEMLTAIQSPRVNAPTGLSLNDDSETLATWPNPTMVRPVGAGGNKLKFVMKALFSAGRAQCVIVGHQNQAPVAWLAWRLGRIDRYIVVLHGIEAWRRANWFQRSAMRHAFAVVATTHYTAQTCSEVNNLTTKNFKVIPLCAEPVPVEPDPSFKLDGEFRVLFVGRLARSEQYKGLETLMQAVKHLRDSGIPVKLHVVGDGDDRSRLQALSHYLGLTPQGIAFHGRVSDAKLQSAYGSANVFAMPSAKEGFGIVFLEAMRHGVVCVGGAHGGTPEVFADGVTGCLVPYGDAVALAKCLQCLWDDPALRGQLEQAGRQRFNTEYTFPRFSTRWSALIGADQSAPQ